MIAEDVSGMPGLLGVLSTVNGRSKGNNPMVYHRIPDSRDSYMVSLNTFLFFLPSTVGIQHGAQKGAIILSLFKVFLGVPIAILKGT